IASREQAGQLRQSLADIADREWLAGTPEQAAVLSGAGRDRDQERAVEVDGRERQAAAGTEAAGDRPKRGRVGGPGRRVGGLAGVELAGEGEVAGGAVVEVVVGSGAEDGVEVGEPGQPGHVLAKSCPRNPRGDGAERAADLRGGGGLGVPGV